VTLLDAYALVALVGDEPAAEEVEELLREGECRIPVINFAEAVDVSVRVHAVPAEDVRAAIEPLFLTAVLTPVVSSETEAWAAASLRDSYYDRKQRPLSLADCFLLAHALATGDAIATADPPLAEAARSEGTPIVGLPDRAGNRP
jgi:predicted nucleic acid-binding protein